MKTLTHIIISSIVILLVTLMLWLNAIKQHELGTQIIYYNPHSFSGFLGTMSVPVLLGLVLPATLALLALPFGKKHYRNTFVALLYIMIGLQLFSAFFINPN